MASEYINAIARRLDNIDVVAATDPVLERACNIADEQHSYEKAEDMYKHEDIDAVYIAIPHHLHEPMIKQALENGKHILCEKPVSNSIESARRILELDKKYPNLKVGIHYQYRYDYNCFNLASGIQKSHLGKIYYAICDGFFYRDFDYINLSPWRAKMSTSGGGTLLIQASHIIDIILWALGKPTSVIGRIDNLKFKNIEVEDIGFGIIEFNSGSYAQISNSMITAFPKPRKKRIADFVELNIYGEKGSCFYEGPWPLTSLKWSGVEEFNFENNSQNKNRFVIDKKNPSGDWGECFRAFAEWVLNDIPFFNTIEESSKVLCVIKALYKSSKSGKQEKIDWL
jgi:predicted dehydrogenase